MSTSYAGSLPLRMVAIFTSMVAISTAGADEAKRILDATGVRGGLVVQLGVGDGKLTAALAADDGFVVQGLDTDATKVAKAREQIRKTGRYGTASVDTYDGKRLPYADNLVNLIIADDAAEVSRNEMLRALAPLGVAYLREGGEWTKIVKPYPDKIDEWTHHLYDAGGNPVARDRVAGPPRRLQWTAGPTWARSHGWTPSVTSMVSSAGRLFYICDETLTGVDATVPNKWYLVARDAFSGVLLWKRPIPVWGSVPLSGTPDDAEGVPSVGRFTMPLHSAKRLVAIGDTVYTTLGAHAPITAIDAATGETKKVYKGTERTDEFVVTDGRLVVAINPPERPKLSADVKTAGPKPAPGKDVCVVDVKSGNILWRKGPFQGVRAAQTQDPFGRLELAAGDNAVFVLTPETIECLAIDTGKQRWKIDRPALPEKAVRRMGFSGMFEFLLTVLVYKDGVLLLAQPEPNTHHTYHTMPGTLYAFDAEDGSRLWKHAYGGWGHCTQPDVFVIDKTVWTHVNADTEFGSVWGSGYRAKDSSNVDYRIQALDLLTGKMQKELPTKDLFNVGHHHRCYRNRITERYLLASRRGVEFVDLESGENQQHHWVRSGCLLGNLPCNGLIYVTPHPCGCYINAKLTGFNALAPAAGKSEPIAKNEEQRLQRGPAYGKIASGESSKPNPSDWPTYRHDGQRSGATATNVPAKLKTEWKADLGAKPSAPVVADGKVFVAAVDEHTVHALDADNGKPLWDFTAGARVASPPSYYRGMAIFGVADGCVYCVRASDGELVWRFDAAPEPTRIMSYGQLESVWPVPGVLIHDGKCWFAAGRSSYLDGGIYVYAVDPMTGKIAFEKTIYSPDPTTGKMTPETAAQSMAGVLNDVPATDGRGVFLRQFNVASESGGGPRVFTTGGFLDSSWFNRTFWKYGGAQTTGQMVVGDDAAYGIEAFHSRSRDKLLKPGSDSYSVRCFPKKKVPAAKQPSTKQAPAKGRKGKPKRKPTGAAWEARPGIRMNAMVLADKTLFVAGSPDVVDRDDPHAAWEGRRGGRLAAIDATTGKPLAELKLPGIPAWDGMAAANGRLYLTLENGTILCLGE